MPRSTNGLPERVLDAITSGVIAFVVGLRRRTAELRQSVARRRERRSAEYAFTHDTIGGPRLERDERPASASLPELSRTETMRFTGSVMTVIGLIIAGLVVQLTLVSFIQFHRDQQVNFDSFRYNLANGTAPVGQTDGSGHLLAEGTPVALLSIPALGLKNVVVDEGTSSCDLISGPGHRRDTPLPGQVGTSVVYGRQAAYGGPFSGLGALRVGESVTAVTGQGAAKYTVTAVRYSSTASPTVPDLSDGAIGHLTLVSAAGLPFFPSSVVRVDAKLTSTAFSTPVPALSSASLAGAEFPMMGDGRSWAVLVIALVVMILASVTMLLSRRFWGRWQTWVVAVPVMLLLASFVTYEVVSLLPNLI